MTFSDIKKNNNNNNNRKYDSIPNTKNKKKQKKLCSVGTAFGIKKKKVLRTFNFMCFLLFV